MGSALAPLPPLERELEWYHELQRRLELNRQLLAQAESDLGYPDQWKGRALISRLRRRISQLEHRVEVMRDYLVLRQEGIPDHGKSETPSAVETLS